MTKSKRGKKCPYCGKFQMFWLMHDIDGTNLVEALTCKNCGEGTPAYNQATA